MMRKLSTFLIAFCISFVFFTVALQMLIGYATAQNFVTMSWNGAMFLSLIISIIGAGSESLHE